MSFVYINETVGNKFLHTHPMLRLTVIVFSFPWCTYILKIIIFTTPNTLTINSQGKQGPNLHNCFKTNYNDTVARYCIVLCTGRPVVRDKQYLQYLLPSPNCNFSREQRWAGVFPEMADVTVQACALTYFFPFMAMRKRNGNNTTFSQV